MAITHGMNVDEVDRLGRYLQQQQGRINDIIREINSRVDGAGWVGPDAQKFKKDWWPQHRGKLTQIGKDLHGFGTSAINNASDQKAISGR